MKVSLMDVFDALSVVNSLLGGEARRVGIAAHKPESHREKWAVEEDNPDFTMGTTVTFDSGAFEAVALQAARYLRGFDPNDPETLRDIEEMTAEVLRFAEAQFERQVATETLAGYSWRWCINVLKKVAGKDLARCLERPPTRRREDPDLPDLRRMRGMRIEEDDESPRPWEDN